MSKKLKVKDIIEEIQARKNEKGEVILNQFNKKKFKKVLKALFDDAEFTTRVAQVKSGELVGVDEIKVSEGFRSFVKGVVEKAGIDSAESDKVLSSEFTIDNWDGFYEFIAEAIYLYCEQGNKFDFLPKEDFIGSISVVNVAAEEGKEKDIYNPRTRDYMGKVKTNTKAHKKLIVKGSCPEFLKDKIRIK